DADIIEATITNEDHQFFKVLLALAGKTGDKCRADSDAGNFFSDAFDQSLERFPISAAAHEFEHISRCVLQRHVEIFHRFWGFGDRFEKCIRDMSWISVHYSDPFKILDLAYCANQRGECIDLAEVFAVS